MPPATDRRVQGPFALPRREEREHFVQEHGHVT